jgi:hypothetical protein
VRNHEIFPINQFAGPGYDSWLYDAAVSAWAPNLPEDAQATASYGGYYQARVRPGLRVISLNSNYFTNDNFWLLANLTFADDQLNWIADVLEQASRLDEKVIFIGHAPLLTWNNDIAETFLNITENYRDTILQLFMGHTHMNEYAALHDAQGQPMHVAYTGGSLVPYSLLNPGFTVYEYNRSYLNQKQPIKSDNSDAADSKQLDPTGYLVQNAYSYWLILTEANEWNNTDAQWSIVRCNMSESFGISDLSPQSLFDLAPSYVTNSTLVTVYNDRRNKGYPSVAPSGKSIKCDTSTNTPQENHDCKHAAGLLEKHIQDGVERQKELC